MPDSPSFPIPSELTPDTFCLCLQIPNNDDWKRVFAGLLAQPAYWFNWERDADRSGKILAQYWTKLYDQIDWGIMSCCCVPLQRRLNSDGTMSTSSDGGVTWQDAGDNDPRNTATQLPPLSGDDGSSKRCKAANNIVRQLKDQQAGYSAKIGVITTLAEMAASIVGLAVLVFFDPALVPFLIGAMLELAAALLATSSGAYDALFTDDDWQWVLCEFFCKLNADGTLPADQFTTIQADFDSHFSGNAALTFSSILNLWQLAGVQNALKIPTADNLDCAACTDCSDCDVGSWVEWTALGSLGTILSIGIDYVEVQSENSGAFGAQAAGIYYPDGCCPYNRNEATGENGSLSSYYSLCGHDPAATGGNINTAFAIPCDTGVNMVTIYGGTSVFIVKIFFSHDC